MLKMLKFLIRTIISVGCLGLLFVLIKDEMPAILKALAGINRPLFATAVGIFVSAAFILSRRLQLIFEASDLKLRFTQAANLTFIGYFFNNFLPTSVGGDIVKAMSASKLTKHPVKSVTCVLMDRIFGLFTFVLMPSISFLFFIKESQNPWVPILIYSFLILSFICFTLLFNRRIARKFSFIETILHKIKVRDHARKIYDGLHAFKDHKEVMIWSLLLSIIGQTIGILVLYMTAIALGAKTHVIYFFLLVPVVHLLSMLPSLNGLGIREGAYVYFLTPYIGKEYAAALGILSLSMLFLMSLIGGIVYLLKPNYHVHIRQAAQAA